MQKRLTRGTSLVAIHGLAGDPFTTWTHVQGQPMWLRDLLPQVMPNIRIMTYGYNASFFNYTTKQDVRSIAAKLLAELADLRSGETVSSPCGVICYLPPCGILGASSRYKAITKTDSIDLPQPGRYSREEGGLIQPCRAYETDGS